MTVSISCCYNLFSLALRKLACIITVAEGADSSIKLSFLMLIFPVLGYKIILTTQIGSLSSSGFIAWD